MDNNNASTTREPMYLFAEKKFAQDCTFFKFRFPINTILSNAALNNIINVLLLDSIHIIAVSISKKLRI
mgnify:CR=1 FL=1